MLVGKPDARKNHLDYVPSVFCFLQSPYATHLRCKNEKEDVLKED